ncbi:MAG: hypothetical protein AAGA85_11110 [Bacteroidota bacterium]
MKTLTHLSFVLLVFLFAACGAPPADQVAETPVVGNPPAPGFNLEGSDDKAMQIADKVMTAMGGRANWDNTRYLFWDFFGFRTLLWDKQTGDVRIEFKNEDKKIIVNEKTGQGTVWIDGQVQEQPDTLAKYLEQGKRIWINDSYWLVMPFKLKDSGVTLTYIGEDTTASGEKSDVVRLAFEGVGVTPNNAYDVWVSQQEDLVKQWAFYRDEADSVPGFTRPWDDYVPMGNIKLSAERGARDLESVQVLTQVPNGIFESFDVTL